MSGGDNRPAGVGMDEAPLEHHGGFLRRADPGERHARLDVDRGDDRRVAEPLGPLDGLGDEPAGLVDLAQEGDSLGESTHGKCLGRDIPGRRGGDDGPPVMADGQGVVG
jgi:hypothetical protein